MSPSRLTLVLFFFFASRLASAPQSASPPSLSVQKDAQAVSLVQKSGIAMGGGAAVLAAPSQSGILVSGTFHSVADPSIPDFPFRVKIIGNNRVRWEFDQPDGRVSTVVSGGVGWREGPKGKVGLPLGDMMGRQLEALPFLALGDWASDQNVTLKDIGPETVEGVQLHHVTLAYPLRLEPSGTLLSTYQRVSTCELYLDPNTSLPARLRFKQYPRDIRVGMPIELIFSAYKQLSGFQVPTTVGYRVYDHLAGEFHFESIALNATFAPSDFEVN